MTTTIVDTDVFSILLDARPGAVELAATLEGMEIALAFPSIAELVSGAELARWGAARVARLEAAIAETGLLMPTDTLLWLCGRLQADAVRLGHPLGQKAHANDRWIAACAIHYGVALLTNNERHFAGLPGLELLAEG